MDYYAYREITWFEKNALIILLLVRGYVDASQMALHLVCDHILALPGNK